MLTQTVAGILHEGMKFWNEERRTKFQGRYNKLLNIIDEMQNSSFPDYNDARLGLSNQELENFLTAYLQEIRQEAQK